jgi:enoyl-CoA hydratase/carnithine racemase
MNKTIIREKHGEVERIILNRPQQQNMISDEMRRELTSAFHELTLDPKTQLVVLTGSGDVFSRCADFVEQNEKNYQASDDTWRSFLWTVRDLSTVMRSFPKPIIAAVNGLAAMGGFELALSCDLIVASSTAVLGDGHPSGVGGGGGSQRLLEAVGARMTRWLLYTEELLSAQRAFEIGLVQQVYPAANFDESVMKLAQSIVSRRIGKSLQRIKALTASTEPALAGFDYEIEHSIGHWLSPAATEWRAGFARQHSQKK